MREISVWCQVDWNSGERRVPGRAFPLWDIVKDKAVSVDLCDEHIQEARWLTDLAIEHGVPYVVTKTGSTDTARAPGALWTCLLCKDPGYKTFNSLTKHYDAKHGVKAGLENIYNGQCPIDGETFERLGSHAKRQHVTNIPGLFEQALLNGDKLGIVRANIERVMKLEAA